MPAERRKSQASGAARRLRSTRSDGPSKRDKCARWLGPEAARSECAAWPAHGAAEIREKSVDGSSQLPLRFGPIASRALRDEGRLQRSERRREFLQPRVEASGGRAGEVGSREEAEERGAQGSGTADWSRREDRGR